MAQGEFTKQEAERTKEAVIEVFESLSGTKRGDYLGHLNDICLFLSAAKAVAPNEPEE